ncbi:hypothetical protein [Amycolatopsis sp. NBC_01480]|uniref:hypothetical protein n=1 Tax=Amycolatopsis sp. NBC_01480 TaxID=2903562 RepID=UPI002E2D4014|nr:hypothetical protein [Amycolatopsis sp. NBC_01480]
MSGPYGESAGYSFTPDALNSIVGQLRQGEQELDRVTSGVVRGVDAGASSAAVGTVLSDIVQMATACAGVTGGTAAKVHAANGAYDNIENDAAGQVTLSGQQNTPDSRREDHVHG